VHLRAITLSGFKTFARPTEIVFDGGITAIVGPNGSGKTNIVDAFKWVLGETQARDLRGKKMEEVIYAGGERRPRSSEAEVTILIDNADGRLPVDYREVAIRRRVDRGGQSDYYLNGTRVRRRDLMDLLASTGLTTDSYAILDQSDIESIITSTPEQRRQLIEEAAQVRGVKAKRSEAAHKLRDLAQNLLRLEDLRTEIEPRLELVRAQAAAAREAAEAEKRLEVLRGSIAWEEWREARDAYRRAQSQTQALERRLADARALAETAEEEFRRGRLELEAAQEQRLQRQRLVGGLRLELSAAEHELALAEERMRSQRALAAAAQAEEEELTAREGTARALQAQLASELEVAERELAAVPDPPTAAIAADPAAARAARQAAERARREAAAAASQLASTRTRRQFVEETVARLEAQVAAAEAALPAAEQAAQAAEELVRLRAELAGLESLLPAPRAGLRRLGDVVLAAPGYEAALSAVLGPLVDAWAARDEAVAANAASTDGPQATVLYGAPAPAPRPGSLLDHVACESGFDALAERLLGQVVLGEGAWPRVSLLGFYEEAGLVRAGTDARVALAARHKALAERIAGLEPLAAQAGDVAALRAAAAQRPRLEESTRQLRVAREEEADEAARLPQLGSAAEAAEAEAGALAAALAEQDRRQAALRAEAGQLELERVRWRERAADLRRQLEAVAAELGRIEAGRAARRERAQAAREQAAGHQAGLEHLREAAARARQRLEDAGRQAPEEEAELAAGARKLVAVEEARIDTRLKVTTLEGNLGLAARDAELHEARMQELRGRMPEGLAPEEVPGGKAREREMRGLERRLEEIGPTNPLAERECAELEDRYRTLMTQLEDIAAARQDLERLIGRLREEEESRYDAVFGAVAANFQEFFQELTAGGKATLRHVAGEDGPRSGVEILVQPPRKRLQNVTLLSSGERSLTALALVLALEEVNPSPFTILDEVDAALDDANVGRFAAALERLGAQRQFLVITHNHVTMASGAALYGVHLDESGSSHLVSVRLEDVRKHGVKAALTA
jgi:chromosome segregation protein